MRKLVSLVLILTWLSARPQANVYHPMPDSGAVWCEMYSYGTSTCTYTQEYYTLSMNGDTVVNGLTYHKIYSTGYAYHPNCPGGYTYSGKFYGAMRQDIAQKKVYTIHSNYGAGLEYDFNWQPGDTIPNTNNQFFITHIDSIELSGSYRKRLWVGMYMSPGNLDTNHFSIIEGMGSTVGLMMMHMQGFEMGSGLNAFGENGKGVYPDSTALSSCYGLNGIDIKVKPEQISVFPNPASDQVRIDLPENAVEFSITDMQGKKVIQQNVQGLSGSVNIDLLGVQSGIYIARIKTTRTVSIFKLAVEK